MLHQRATRIFTKDKDAHNAFSISLGRFLVPDSEHAKEPGVVLLLESPHVHEVRYGYPLAGYTGTDVRDALGKEARRLFPNEPIGRSIHWRHPDFLRLGVMNVSQLPFQHQAYDFPPAREAEDCRDHAHWNCYLAHMKTICEGPSAASRSNPRCGELEEAIIGDLRRRLSDLRRSDPSVILVRCGDVAQRFYEKAGVTVPNVCLPHPAKGGWTNLQDKERRALRNVIDRLWSHHR